MSSFRPKARRDDVLSEEMPDELLLYDTTRHEAHLLNRVAAAVWQHCDGTLSVPELARRVGEALGTPASEDLVWHALGELGDRHLLEETPDARSTAASLSRRELVERLTAVAGLTLAVVSSLPVPASAQIGSGGEPTEYPYPYYPYV